MTDDCAPQAPDFMTLDGILDAAPDLSADSRYALRTQLLVREDNMADVLRLAGAQYGLFPQIVAEVLATVGLGTPISTEERTLIHQQWHALMDQLRADQEGEQS